MTKEGNKTINSFQDGDRADYFMSKLSPRLRKYVKEEFVSLLYIENLYEDELMFGTHMVIENLKNIRLRMTLEAYGMGHPDCWHLNGSKHNKTMENDPFAEFTQ